MQRGTTLRYFIVLCVFLNTSPVFSELPATGKTSRIHLTPHPSESRGEAIKRQVYARFVANKTALKQSAAKQRELHKEIEGMFREIRSLRFAAKPAKGQGSCNTCADLAAEYCNRPALYPVFCKSSECHVEPEPKADVCYRVFQNQHCYKTLTASARSRVNDCWKVENRITIGELETEIDNLKSQLDDLEQEELDLRKEELALEEECPSCIRGRLPAAVRKAIQDADEAIGNGGEPAVEN